jgi:hypothetical protein
MPLPSIGPVTRSSTLFGIAAILAGTAVGLLRQPGAGALDTLWAEDGKIFLADATRHGPLGAIGLSYAGYLHAVPRLLTAVATVFPPGAAATVLAIEAALCVALVAVLVYVASADLLASRLSRFLVAGAVVVVPVAQGDVLNSVANFHWYGLYALFWVLLWRPGSTAGRMAAIATVALVATSDILVVTFVPLALYLCLRRPRGRYPVVLAGVLGLGIAIQLAGLVAGSSQRQLDPDPVVAVTGFVLRAVPAPLIGERWLGDSVGTRWVVLAAVAWLMVGAAMVAAYARLTRPAWFLAVVAAVHAAALYLLPVLLSGVATPRYAVAPALLVVTALAALLQPASQPEPARPGRHSDTAGPGRSGRAAGVPLYALAAVLTVVCAVNLRVDNSRADGPRWSEQLPAARQRCADTNTGGATPGGAGSAEAGSAEAGSAEAGSAEAGSARAGVVVIPIAPTTEGWTASLACDYVLR